MSMRHAWRLAPLNTKNFRPRPGTVIDWRTLLFEAEVLEHGCAKRIAVEGRRVFEIFDLFKVGLFLLFCIFLEGGELSENRGATSKVLGVSRQTLNNVIHGKSGISPEMAIRLSKAFGSTPETWLRMQLAYDLAQARKDEDKIKVRRQRVPQELHAE